MNTYINDERKRYESYINKIGHYRFSLLYPVAFIPTFTGLLIYGVNYDAFYHTLSRAAIHAIQNQYIFISLGATLGGMILLQLLLSSMTWYFENKIEALKTSTTGVNEPGVKNSGTCSLEIERSNLEFSA